MNIKLLNLELSDFKGLRDFTFCPGGKNAIIRGANGSGKSTVMTAFLWLLTGKDAQGRSDFNIFPIGADGKRISGCFPEVTASLQIDGHEVMLSRALVEKWSKRTGAAETEYKGDETKCCIDEVPTSITEYNKYIEGLCPANLMPLLLNSNWFSEQTKDYKERRELLLSYFGDVSESEILNGAPDLAPLVERLEGRSVDGYRKICAERKKKYADAINALPARIDENRNMLKELPDAESVKKKISKLNVEIAKLQYTINNTDAGTVLQEKKKQRAAVLEQLSAIPIKRQALESCSTTEWRKDHEERLQATRSKKQAAEDMCIKAQRLLTDLESHKQALEDKVERLRNEWIEENAKTANIINTCPTCGQAIPPDDIAASLENFNLSKSAALDSIVARANAAKEQLTQVSDQLNVAWHSKVDNDAILTAANEHFEAVYAEIPPLVDMRHLDNEEAALRETITALDSAIADAGTAAQAASAEYQSQLDALSATVQGENQTLAQIQQNENVKKRIQALEAEQLDAVGNLEEAEHGLALCDEYTRVMVSTLTDRVNNHFPGVRFKLFEQLKNGGLKEVCEATLGGVPYGSLNTAGKMQTNVQIVQAFSLAAGHALPLFLDNRESVSSVELPENLQIINLYVDPTQPRVTYEI